MFLSLRIIFRH